MTTNFRTNFRLRGDVPPPDLPAAPSGNPMDLRPTYRGGRAVAAGLGDVGRQIRATLVVWLEEESEVAGGVSGLISWVDFLSALLLIFWGLGLSSLFDDGTDRFWIYRGLIFAAIFVGCWLAFRLGGGGRWRKFLALLVIAAASAAALAIGATEWTPERVFIAILLGVIGIFVFLILREMAR